MFVSSTSGRKFAAVFGAVWVASTVQAQPAVSDSDPLEEIIVTGTSLKGTAPVGTAVQVLDSENLRNTGMTDTNQILKSIPAMVNLGQNEGRGGGVQGAQGNITQATTLNLRGLGSESTLVLLNGRRIAPAGTQGAGYDVSIIPTNAIGRIEVIADGASAIYGSEAVGGVVNFITKRNYTGAETTLRYGFAEGFDEKKIGQNFGFSWGSGSVFAAYEHYERGGLMGSDREEVTTDLRARGGPDLRLNFATPGNVVIGTGAAATLYAVPAGTRGTGLSATQFIAGTQRLEDYNLTRSLLVDTTQDTALASVTQDFGEDLSFWFEAQYSRRVYDGFGTSLNRGTGTAVLAVPVASPYYISFPGNAGALNVNYSFSGLFPFRNHGGEEEYHAATGLTWDVGNDWAIDAAINRNGNNPYRRADQIWTFNLPEVLLGSTRAPALNPFCDTNAFSNCNSQSTIDLLRGYNIIAAEYHEHDFQLKASGPLYHLPGGDVALAIGASYLRADLTTTISLLTVGPVETQRPTKADRNVEAGFAELLVPVFGNDNARTGLRKLDLSAAIRYEKYSDFGNTTNPKFGVTWKPIDSLSLRGSFGSSFRAPTLTNIDFLSTTTYAALTINDPNRPGGAGNIRAVQLIGGRPGIQPEEADTLTFGFDFAPSFLPGLKTSLSYYDIDYTNRITTVSAANILANPAVYGQFIQRNPTVAEVQAYTNSVYYTSPQENPANFVAIIDTRTANLGGLKQSGIDGVVTYDFEAFGSQWHSGVNVTKILEATQSAAPGLPYLKILDQINNPVSLRARANLGWAWSNLRADAFVNHVGTYSNNLRPLFIEEVDSWTTLDLSASYTVPKDDGRLGGLRFALSLTNATDADPPSLLNTTTGVEGFFDPQNASVIGRFVAFELSKSW